MDVKKQIDYWSQSGDEDFSAAQSLLDRGHLRHCLFFAHLAVEKMLKAHVTRQTEDLPPRIHSLVRLAEIAELSLSTEHMSFLSSFGMYQLEGRYPDSGQLVLDTKTAREKLALSEDILKWLRAQL